ncbi:bifunctional 4-hydroxy-2-oxoglutarate aldolase/2-dehydro-3-deoxy-phosphogluconate aldolase [Aquibacillus kalidii]|uniref:bifunctional 4-hydroxy-2-oxoglutarate aldolase/2-dehydro-3-deoxy-phosphogluconate aldolase n=1 Tax=Aquibacillus kalidii TaxID=2762597 RepID=UPI0016461A1B|nr:bifunctional 4-hydroxy-2-oxoglutarate aldolase/2-dehydro-3-deoxy-phosphogluconate aldolase [Aquibacillus kalidii]
MSTLEIIKGTGVVAVIRKASVDNILPIAEALVNGGIKAIEITLESPGALEAINIASQKLGNKAVIGAGTVLDSETARVAIMNGAKFVFSPTINIETIKISKRYGVMCVAGALTPTEILTAFEHGSDIIKVFPASLVGPKYFKDLHGPLPQIPLMPTGGVDIENAGDYIQAGAVAVGVGSTLVSSTSDIDDDYLRQIEYKASEFIERIKLVRV